MLSQAQVSGFPHYGIYLTSTLRRYPEAKANYVKVLELDPRHPLALGFLGMVHHFLGEVDNAIVRYHEVGLIPCLVLF